jgi:hypothetical protein
MTWREFTTTAVQATLARLPVPRREPCREGYGGVLPISRSCEWLVVYSTFQ